MSICIFRAPIAVELDFDFGNGKTKATTTRTKIDNFCATRTSRREGGGEGGDMGVTLVTLLHTSVTVKHCGTAHTLTHSNSCQ